MAAFHGFIMLLFNTLVISTMIMVRFLWSNYFMVNYGLDHYFNVLSIFWVGLF